MIRYSTLSILTSVPDHLPNKAFRRKPALGEGTWWRKRRLRRRHEGSCLSEDSLFDLCGCSRCFGDRVFGGAFPLTGRRAVLAAASASKRISALRSVTVVLLIDPSCMQQVPRVVVVVSFAHPRSERP
jgi:hypothetical protein